MLMNMSRLVRLVAMITIVYSGVKQLRSMYGSRKHLWQILRRLVRQLG